MVQERDRCIGTKAQRTWNATVPKPGATVMEQLLERHLREIDRRPSRTFSGHCERTAPDVRGSQVQRPGGAKTSSLPDDPNRSPPA